MKNLFFLVGDLNIISLDYSINANVCDFFNLVFQNREFDKKNRYSWNLEIKYLPHNKSNVLSQK